MKTIDENKDNSEEPVKRMPRPRRASQIVEVAPKGSGRMHRAMRDVPINIVGASSVSGYYQTNLYDPVSQELSLESLKNCESNASIATVDEPLPDITPIAASMFRSIKSHAMTIFVYHDILHNIFDEYSDIFDMLKKCETEWTVIPVARKFDEYYGPSEKKSHFIDEAVELLYEWTGFKGPFWIYSWQSFIGDFFLLDRLLMKRPLTEILTECKHFTDNKIARHVLRVEAGRLVSQANSDCEEVLREERMDKENYQFGMVVIGGGNSGIAAARSGSRDGFKVALYDFVEPTAHGHTWQVGGTCLMVGCIPKKILHYASTAPVPMNTFESHAWSMKTPLPEGKEKFNYGQMMGLIRDYLGGGSFSYKKFMKGAGITFQNGYVRLSTKDEDPHTLEVESGKGKKKKTTKIRARNVVLATGLRPMLPNIEGAKLIYVTDDFFFSHNDPNVTIIVGGSFSALETACVVRNFGYPVKLLVRSKLLRGYDQDAIENMTKHIVSIGIEIFYGTHITKVEDTGQLDEDGVTPKLKASVKHKDGSEEEWIATTILYAIGRDGRTKTMNLEKAPIEVSQASGQVPTVYHQTTQSWVFAVGDIKHNAVQAAPVASAEGAYIGARLSKIYTEPKSLHFPPTICFTEIPYGCFGLSEADAYYLHDYDAIRVYEREFFTSKMLFRDVLGTKPVASFCKWITVVEDSVERIYGLHIICPECEVLINGLAPVLRVCPDVEFFKKSNPAVDGCLMKYVVETLNIRFVKPRDDSVRAAVLASETSTGLKGVNDDHKHRGLYTQFVELANTNASN